MEPAHGASPGDGAAELLLRELERQVQDVVRASSWWERRGVDCAILALSLLALPAGETKAQAAVGGGARLKVVQVGRELKDSRILDPTSIRKSSWGCPSTPCPTRGGRKSDA